MSDENIDHDALTIQNEIAESISEKLNMPVIKINPTIKRDLYDILKQETDILKKYSASELQEEISNFVINLHVEPAKDEEDTEKRITEFLKSLEKEKKYEAFMILPSVIDLPIGTKIGKLVIVEQKEIKDKHLVEFIEYHKKRKRIYLDGRSQARITFTTYRSVNVSEVLYKTLELPFAILSLILNTDLSARDCIGSIKSLDIPTTFFLEPQKETLGWSRYNRRYHEKYFEQLSKITLVQKQTALQKKILQAVQIYGLSRFSQKKEIRFLFLISSFESLLLTKSDRDYLGMKLSEKTSFILEDNYEKRIKLYKQMKKYYSKRSKLVHEGKTQISNVEIRNLNNVFRKTVFKLLELSTTYTKMEQREKSTKPEGIEDLINQLKFT